MDFQAAVATWFAVHILVRMPVGGRFGIDNEALPVAMRLETGEALDDIEVLQSDGGVVHCQCKTSASLSTGQNAPLGKTVGQLVRWVSDAKAADALPDRSHNAAVLAVHVDASRTLNDLNSGCRAFDLGGSWVVTRTQRNQAERSALDAFETIASAAWIAHRGAAPDVADLQDLAQVFHVARFAMGEGESDWRECSRLLGRRLFGDEAVGDAALRDLKGIMRHLIGNGAPANRAGLMRALRQRGHFDVRAPRYDLDIAKLGAVTSSELSRLAVHGRLPLGAGVPIRRDSHAPLVAAILAGPLLVVGEPGAGKTGALVHAAAAIASAGNTVVFLSVDRYPGVTIAADLVSDLGLSHPLVETLDAMPGTGRKVLIIDALDATRGGPSEAVFATLIEHVCEQLANDWTVVASIRTFDLKNGRRFRRAFAGAPADTDHADSALSTVRHFLVPRLTESDLSEAGAASPELRALLASAPPPLAQLLRNIFNLSLAAELLADGTAPAAFSAIRTQSGLIDAYEDARLDTTPLQEAAGAAAAAMIGRRRLSARKVAVRHPSLDAVIQTGVLAETGDLVSFAHHVLFDHVAGRFHLAWNDPDTLLAQIAGNTSTALQLAPALRFAVERLWRNDEPGRPLSWQLLIGIYSATSVDPVLSNVALRIVAENIENEADLAGLTARVTLAAANPSLVALLGGLARFAAMGIERDRAVAPLSAIAWSRLAEALVETGERAMIYPVRVVLHSLFEHVELADKTLLNMFGRAARALLELAWAASPPLTTTSTSAIRYVGKSFASNPAASRALLDRILREPHFSQYADQEAMWLAEQIVPITQDDPEFAVEIYAALYGRSITDNTVSWLGGQRSRIISLSTNRRQEYASCLWRLGTAMGKVLAITPDHGTRALIDALIGKAQAEGYRANDNTDSVTLGTKTIELRGYDTEWNKWEEEDERVDEADLLHHYVRFLNDCDSATFAVSVEAASLGYATGSIWARIFGVGSERVAEVGNLLWPLVANGDFLQNSATMRDAIRFIAAAWASRTREERVRFETMAIDGTRITDTDELRRWRLILGRVLALLPQESLELDQTKLLRGTLNAEGLLTENQPLNRDVSYPDENGNFVHDQLRRAGADLDIVPNREVLESADALDVNIKQASRDSPAPTLAALWGEAVALMMLIDSSSGLHEQVERLASGRIARVITLVASSPTYVPSGEGQPELATMFATLERLSSSPHPEPRGRGITISWGDGDIRVHAANGWVSLARRFAAEYPAIIDMLEVALADPAPAVRLQAAQSLHVIYLAAPERMWAIGEQIAARETDTQILAAYMRRSMARLRQSDPVRCEIVLGIVKDRLDGDVFGDQQGRDHLQESLGDWTAQLFVWQGRELARTWLETWASDPERYGDLLNFFLSCLRAAFFMRYQGDSDAEACAICDRAQESFMLILSSVSSLSATAHNILTSDSSEADKQGAGKRYRGAATVTHNAMNQLFFGSGAHAEGVASGRGLPDSTAKARFLRDYAEILAMLASTHEPGTLHHLIELYEFLIPGDPVAVFDAVHVLMTRRGAEEGYQYERLGNTAIVRMMQGFIADYRPIFEDEGPRAKLVEILKLFSEAGRDEALKLLYELPDLLR